MSIMFTLFLMSLTTVSYPSDTNALFRKGLEQYHTGAYQDAKTSFQTLLEKYPNNPSLLLNLGLTQYQLGDHGVAIGLWRKALEHAPFFNKASQAIDFVQKQSPVMQQPHQMTWEERLQKYLLRYVSWDICLLFIALFGFTFAWWQIRYFVALRKWQSHKQKFGFSSVPIFLLGFTFLIVASLVTLKIRDYWIPKATVVTLEVAAKAGPSEDMATLFNLFEGLDVKIKQTHEDWVQVMSLGGQIGWVQKKDLFYYAGRRPW